MKLLNHLNPADHVLLGVIDDNWPFQFLSEYSRFHTHFYNESINIVYDEELNVYMPLRFLDLKLFAPAQIMYAPLRNHEEIGPREQLQFYNKLISLLQQTGRCERLLQPNPYAVLASFPDGSKHCDFGTYIIDLENQSEEEILEKFHPKYQKAVVHSQKHAAEVRIGIENLRDFYSTYSNTMKRANLHFDSYEYFEMLWRYLGDDRVCCAVVYDEGVAVSGIFLIHTLHSAFLTHAGTQGESKLYGAAKLLNYEVMKYLKAKGVKKYDFVGVRLKNNNPSLEGIFRFKKGFGGELKEGYLWKLDILPMKAKAYDLINKLRKGKTKNTDIIDQVNNE